MPGAKGQDWEKFKKTYADDEIEEKKITPLSAEYACDGSKVAKLMTLGTSRSSRPTARLRTRYSSKPWRRRSRRSKPA
jgi:hypothetical protein